MREAIARRNPNASRDEGLCVIVCKARATGSLMERTREGEMTLGVSPPRSPQTNTQRSRACQARGKWKGTAQERRNAGTKEPRNQLKEPNSLDSFRPLAWIGSASGSKEQEKSKLDGAVRPPTRPASGGLTHYRRMELAVRLG